MRKVVIGTRQSALALTQTGQVLEALQAAAERLGVEVEWEVRKIVTRGDRILDVSLSKVGGKGLFVKEIEHALLTGEIDLAVHSMKDMPSELPEGLVIGAVPQREDPRDCLVSSSGLGLAQLPHGARIGTSSLRRASQLKAARPDVSVEVLRGNIDSRLRRLETGELDAVMLAAAGLRRMGWEDRVSEYVEPEVCLPAVGQGALALECRQNDTELLVLLQELEHTPTAAAAAAERSFLHTLQGGCQVPIGAYAVVSGGEDTESLANRPGSGGEAPEAERLITLTGMVGSPDGAKLIRDTMTGADPVILGRELAMRLIDRGADRILAQVRSESHEQA